MMGTGHEMTSVIRFGDTFESVIKFEFHDFKLVLQLFDLLRSCDSSHLHKFLEAQKPPKQTHVITGIPRKTLQQKKLPIDIFHRLLPSAFSNFLKILN